MIINRLKKNNFTRVTHGLKKSQSKLLMVYENGVTYWWFRWIIKRK
jgi:hypothetical protein